MLSLKVFLPSFNILVICAFINWKPEKYYIEPRLTGTLFLLEYSTWKKLILHPCFFSKYVNKMFKVIETICFISSIKQGPEGREKEKESQIRFDFQGSSDI